MVAILLVVILGMVAFAVDIGYLSVVQKEMQNAADAAAMAGAAKMLDRGALKGVPNQSGTNAAARDEAQEFSALNKGGGVSLTLSRNDSNAATGDIVIGRLDSPNLYTANIDPNSARPNSVRVKVNRNSAENGPVPLFFGTVFGRKTQNMTVTATATYEKDGVRGFRVAASGAATSKLLPFTLEVHQWTNAPGDPWYDASLPGGVMQAQGPDAWTYDPNTHTYAPGSDGVHEVNLYPTKGNSPGNFGTVNLGQSNNGTPELERQILYGPNATDMAAFGGQIALGADGTLVLPGNPGISAGFKDDLASIRGQLRIIPLYQSVTGQGANTYYTIVAFVGMTILDVDLTGNNKHVTIQPEYVADVTAMTGGTASNSFFVTKPLRLTR
jgi:Flp pilus assembly protein TadG